MMNETEEIHIVDLCETIARKAHEGQTRHRGADKGKSYIIHPERMAGNADSYITEAICWLHDTLEDTDLTKECLVGLGVPEAVVYRVMILSKKKGEGYLDFILRVSGDALATYVKVLDIQDNLKSLEPCCLRDKYLMALYILGNK